ncbi:MAG: hypothetical protein FWG99_10090 [Treponema sp.]|nr:hypothetical protein [Treponema sp.]
MKKLFITVFVSTLVSFPLFSIDLSAGGGFKITPYTEQLQVSAEGYKTAYIKYNWTDWGVYAFFDAKYVEFDVSYYRALAGSYSQSSFGYPLDLETEYGDLNISYLDLALFVKYPFRIKSSSIIPLFGFAYKINLTSDYGYNRNEGDVPKEDWDQMWIKTGVGYDLNINRKLFARTAITICFPLETDGWIDKRIGVKRDLSPFISGVKTTFGGIGCEFLLAMGYRIF